MTMVCTLNNGATYFLENAFMGSSAGALPAQRGRGIVRRYGTEVSYT